MVKETFENETIEFFKDWSSGRSFSDSRFIRCHFVGCDFSSLDIANLDSRNLVSLRSSARRIEFLECDFAGCAVGPGIVEDCSIDTAKSWNHLQTFGTVFKHVTVRGEVNKLMITPYVDIFGKFPDVQRQFDEANREFYQNVDWALDISKGIFNDCDIRGVPSALIRRDVETQVVLTRERAIQGRWRDIDLLGTHWPNAIQLFLDEGHADTVLVAPKKARKFRVLMEGLNRLRDFEITEPD